MYKYLSVCLCALVLGCESEPVSPEDVYLSYVARSADGMSFDDELDYWSEEKASELNEKLESLIERSKKTREDAIELYMTLSKQIAECLTLELLSKEVVQDSAYIVFAATNNCDDRDVSLHYIRLVLEQAWKLSDIEIAF